MGIVLRFRHAASRSRAASSANASHDNAALRAVGVATIAVHRSGGIQRRCHHLLTLEASRPNSEAIAARVGHSSIIDRNEVNSDMDLSIGRPVLKSKPKSCHDADPAIGQTVLMSAGAYRQGFIQRTREARIQSGLTQEEIAKKLGITQGTYKNYENNRPLPHQYVRQFCDEVGLEPTELYPPSAKNRRKIA
jgi:helix-turn-helix protein